MSETVAAGDVVQCDPEHSRWGPVFVIVEEIKPWGITGYFFAPTKPGEPMTAYVRVEHGKYVRIGRAEWVGKKEGA